MVKFSVSILVVAVQIERVRLRESTTQEFQLGNVLCISFNRSFISLNLSHDPSTSILLIRSRAGLSSKNSRYNSISCKIFHHVGNLIEKITFPNGIVVKLMWVWTRVELLASWAHVLFLVEQRSASSEVKRKRYLSRSENTLFNRITVSKQFLNECFKFKRNPFISTTKTNSLVLSQCRRKRWPIPTFLCASSIRPGKSATEMERKSAYFIHPTFGLIVVTEILK